MKPTVYKKWGSAILLFAALVNSCVYRASKLHEYDYWSKELNSAGIEYLSFSVEDGGRLDLDLHSCSLPDWSNMTDMPITALRLSETAISNLLPLIQFDLGLLDISWCNSLHSLDPLSEMNLETLYIGGYCDNDLSAIEGLHLKSLSLNGSFVTNINGLVRMPLERLSIANTGVSSLFPVSGSNLSELYLYGSVIADLSNLEGARLNILDLRECYYLQDITSLSKVKVKHLRFTPSYVRKGINKVRNNDSILMINGMPADKFWQDYDAGKLGKQWALTGISYCGGDGKSIQMPVVIEGKYHQSVHVMAEDVWLEHNYPEYKRISTSTITYDDKKIHKVMCKTKGGNQEVFFFDVSDSAVGCIAVH